MSSYSILGIDPGSRHIGFCVLTVHGALSHTSSYSSAVSAFPFTIDHLKTLHVHQEQNFFKRVWQISEYLQQLLLLYKPTSVSLEGLIYVKSPTALMKLAQVRGAILAVLGAQYADRVFEYSPNLIKQTVTGFGHADKEAIQKILKLRFPQLKDIVFDSYDSSDALMIALCHYLHKSKSNIELVNPLTSSEETSPQKIYTSKKGTSQRTSQRKGQRTGLGASVEHFLMNHQK